MKILNYEESISLLSLFGATIIALVLVRKDKNETSDSFLVANRNSSLLKGAFSIAVSWIWAPAIFICSLQAYTKGLAGIFWFTLPNILCFFVFAPFAVKVRKLVPNAYTLPEVIDQKFKDKNIHIAFLIIFFGYQLGAIIINSLAGGTLLNAVSGIDTNLAIVSISLIALAYSLISGLKASIFTDVIQMLMILIIAIFIVPLCFYKLGGMNSIKSGLAGINGEGSNILNPWIAFSLGIPLTIGLIAGPFGDQMFFQRAFAVKENKVAKTFIYGGLLFGIVPVILSLLGFMGVTLVNQGQISVSDPQMIGPIVISHLLPKSALYLFCLMAFAGLCSTMDSALCAISSLSSIDVYKKYFNENADDRSILNVSRMSMIFFTVLGTSIALLRPKLLWVFIVYGTFVSAGLFPTIFSICWDRVTARGIKYAIYISIILGTPVSIYANIKEDPYLITYSSIFSVFISLIICLVFTYANNQKA